MTHMTGMTGVSTFREENKLCFFSVMTCHEKKKLFLCICMNVEKSVIPVMTRHAPAITPVVFSFQPPSRFILWQSQRPPLPSYNPTSSQCLGVLVYLCPTKEPTTRRIFAAILP